MYPGLKFVIQDRAPVVETAKGIWAEKNPTAVKENRVAFTPHDFFTPNPVQAADVYFLRFILYVPLSLRISRHSSFRFIGTTGTTTVVSKS